MVADLRITYFSHKISAKEVEKKLKSIRSQYNREKQKTKKRKTGQGLDEVYVSKWAHFGRLKFLDEYLSPRSSQSNLPEVRQFTYIYTHCNTSHIHSTIY